MVMTREIGIIAGAHPGCSFMDSPSLQAKWPLRAILVVFYAWANAHSSIKWSNVLTVQFIKVH